MNLENIRLLLVDDEADFRAAIARRLGKRGLIPEQAGSGEECLRLLEKTPMDVVVLDVKMPAMDGIETLSQIKRKHPKTEVILLTGQATTQDGVEGIKSGAFDYLTKPIELEHLLGKIRQAFDKILRLEEKQKEVQLRAKMEQQMIATERLASLGTLAAGVAHEINNPLAIILEGIGWMQLVLKRKELAAMPVATDLEKALAKMENAVERARRITHQLLGFVKKHDSVFSEVNLSELAHEAIQLVNREAANKNIQIVLETAPSLATIRSDPYRLRQVFLNLLTNALYATPSGGRITLTMDAIGQECLITVKDTGPGIPKENLDKIFEPFFTTKSPGEGTGLGLFVTRGIIEKLGGKIEVDSRLGDGAAFRIRLPIFFQTNETRDQNINNGFKMLEKVKGEKAP